MIKTEQYRYCFCGLELGTINKNLDLEYQIYVLGDKEFMIFQSDSTISLEHLAFKLGIEFTTLQQKLAERIFMKSPFPKSSHKKFLSHTVNPANRIVQTLKLKNNVKLIKEYKNAHRPENVSKQILFNMDKIGILDMELYVKHFQAYLIMDIPYEFYLEEAYRKWELLPMEKEWQSRMARYQDISSDDGLIAKWKVMPRII